MEAAIARYSLSRTCCGEAIPEHNQGWFAQRLPRYARNGTVVINPKSPASSFLPLVSCHPAPFKNDLS